MPPRNENAWTLTFNLAEFTPGEVEKMTGLSTTMQRDWRSRGYLPKSPKHARFDVFSIAETLVMKMFSDQGKGPQQTFPHAPRVALAIVSSALAYRTDAWSSPSPEEVFDSIPRTTRSATTREDEDMEALEQARAKPAPAPGEFDYDRFNGNDRVKTYENYVARGEDEPRGKREWLASRLYSALGVPGLNAGHRGRVYLKTQGQAIWWPTGEMEMSRYDDDKYHVADTGEPFDRIDPKFDGPALVLDILAVAANFVRRAPRPFLTVSLEVNPNAQPVADRFGPRDQGHVVVKIGNGK